MKKQILAVAVLLAMTACTDKSLQMVKLSELSLRQSLGENSDVKILGYSEPDSTFGTNYLTPDEKKAVMGTMKKVTDQIMWLSVRCGPALICARCSSTVTRRVTGAVGK